MKKAILILLVGLFWCNVGNTLNKPIWTQAEIDNHLRQMEKTYDDLLQKYDHLGICVLAQSTNPYSMANAYTCHEDDENLAKEDALKNCRKQDKTPCIITRVRSNIVNQVGEKISTERAAAKEKKQVAKKLKTNTDDKIAQAKQICKDLGFKTKTEKFADCSLKMLSMQFEVQNRETSSDGGTQQKIVVNQGYSVGDAMIALSGIISDANNVRSSYGGGNCRIFQHAYHASLKCN